MSIKNGLNLCSMVFFASSSSAKPTLSAIQSTASLTTRDGFWEKTAAVNSALRTWRSLPYFALLAVTKAVLSSNHSSSSSVTGWGHGFRGPR